MSEQWWDMMNFRSDWESSRDGPELAAFPWGHAVFFRARGHGTATASRLPMVSRSRCFGLMDGRRMARNIPIGPVRAWLVRCGLSYLLYRYVEGRWRCGKGISWGVWSLGILASCSVTYQINGKGDLAPRNWHIVDRTLAIYRNLAVSTWPLSPTRYPKHWMDHAISESKSPPTTRPNAAV